MAKYRHRVFEMYEGRDEAVHALTPRTERATPETTDPAAWAFAHLAVARLDGVIHVQFKAPGILDDTTVPDFRKDLAGLADLLSRDSKVLLDFTDVTSFGASAISALISFTKSLQTKGSRIALCCLAPAIRESFFVS